MLTEEVVMGDWWTGKLQREVERLFTENQRLREALEVIRDGSFGVVAKRTAKDALEHKVTT